MKKYLSGVLSLLCAVTALTGCGVSGEKTANLSWIYGATAFISLLLLAGCLCLVRKNKKWFILLFSSVLVVNSGYTLLSVSPNESIAVLANRISYLGSVFLPYSMLMIIMNITNTKRKRWLTVALAVLSVLVFHLAASPLSWGIYYKSVAWEQLNGVSVLKKEYGSLHFLYLVYLVGYFSAMVGIIARASSKKRIDSPYRAVIIAAAVLVNIGVWFAEQIVQIDFEFLSVSYIITEVFLLGVYLLMNENQHLRELVKQKDDALLKANAEKARAKEGSVSAEAMKTFADGLQTLTHRERQIYEYYLQGASTKDIMTALSIKENTLKFHNKNLYGRLGVSSRKQLVAVHAAIKEDMSKNGEKAAAVIE